MKSRWALFISGQGSNMAALLDLRHECSMDLVISSRADANGLKMAERRGIPCQVLPSQIDWQKVYRDLIEKNITHLFLVGFMKVVPAEFLMLWQKPIYNIHPSLLPAYPGLKSVERAYADQAAIGATVHRVTADVDAGAIVMQKEVFAAGSYGQQSLEQVKFAVHLAEYELVRKVVRSAC